MDTRKIYEQRKAVTAGNSHKEPKVNMKDWVSVTLSCLALGVSAGAAYFNIIRQTDDIRIATLPSPFVVLDDQGKIGVSGQQQITFINSGNRDAAITDLSLVLVRLKDAPPDDTQCDEAKGSAVASLLYDFEPFITRPGDIVVKTFTRTLYPDLWKTSSTDNNLKFFDLGSSMFGAKEIVFTCLRLSVTTPDKFIADVLVPKHYIPIEDVRHDGSVASSVKSVFDSNKPYRIVQKTTTLFSR